MDSRGAKWQPLGMGKREEPRCGSGGSQARKDFWEGGPAAACSRQSGE